MSRETYYYGLQLLFFPTGLTIGFIVLYFFYIPVFYELRYTSQFEYLEKRFNKSIRLVGSGIYSISQIIYALLILYSSCTAVAKVIPVPFYLLTSIVCWLCLIYTLLGGIRGVVWSDFIQALFMYVSVITILVISIQNVGGINKVLDIAREGGRLHIFNFDPSIFSRYSSWTLFIAGFTLSLQIVCTNAGVIQRCLSLPTFKKAKMVIICSGVAFFISFSSYVIVGLLIYTTYYKCDPVMSKELKHADELVTYHVLKVGRKMSGLSGLFLAGILSASLSSISTIMNSLSGIIFEDFVKTFAPFTLNNARTNLSIKSIVALLAVIINGGIFVLDPTAGLLQMATTMLSLTGGLMIFIISFGFFLRKANTKAIIIGALSGILITLWISLGSMWSIAAGKVKYTTKITSIEGCIGNFNHTFENLTLGSPLHTPVIFDDNVPYLYRISFNLFTAIGLIVSFTVGYLFTLCTKQNKHIDENLLIPQLRKEKHDYKVILSANNTNSI
ncbi:sodium-coupled monocarboxylate transporter 1-like [Rhodnius prolixus]|uniref:sodium-coupled monocarboxylate transporter 1-like n=1 Tax=Rhodnius prolixus TaxID=13249 RepID=UPI003D188F1D